MYSEAKVIACEIKKTSKGWELKGPEVVFIPVGYKYTAKIPVKSLNGVVECTGKIYTKFSIKPNWKNIAKDVALEAVKNVAIKKGIEGFISKVGIWEIGAIAAPVAWIGVAIHAFWKLDKYDKERWKLRTVVQTYTKAIETGLRGYYANDNAIAIEGSKAGNNMRNKYLTAYKKLPEVIKWLKENNKNEKNC
jgi:hypothetical protein